MGVTSALEPACPWPVPWCGQGCRSREAEGLLRASIPVSTPGSQVPGEGRTSTLHTGVPQPQLASAVPHEDCCHTVRGGAAPFFPGSTWKCIFLILRGSVWERGGWAGDEALHHPRDGPLGLGRQDWEGHTAAEGHWAGCSAPAHTLLPRPLC